MEELSERKSGILRAVVEAYVSTGRPVGSRALSSQADFGLAPSTLRNELASLEHLGYLGHPHTSAGRVPTDKGYRFYVECRMGESRAADEPEEDLEGELEEALRRAAGMLASTTGLMALVSAPPQSGSEIRHVEVLRLHPDLVMVVVITASGGVVKKLFVFDGEVDEGLIAWARGFLNEAVSGLDLGSRRLWMRLEEPGLSLQESAFVRSLSAAFEVDAAAGTSLYTDGVSRFVSRLEQDGSDSVGGLIEMLDRREEIVGLLSEAMAERSVYLRIGAELRRTAMRECSLVAATYGVANRNLGAVGVLGPTRMDYLSVIGSVRSCAGSLSRLVEEIYQ